MLAVAALVTGACSSAETAGESARVRTLSARRDMITGGDVLVRVELPPGVSADMVSVEVAARDVTGQFRARGEGALEGLVTDLSPGPSLLSVSIEDSVPLQLQLVSHPLTGPVFSGPHQQPFVCQTEQFELPSGETVGAALDDDCTMTRRGPAQAARGPGGPTG